MPALRVWSYPSHTAQRISDALRTLRGLRGRRRREGTHDRSTIDAMRRFLSVLIVITRLLVIVAFFLTSSTARKRLDIIDKLGLFGIKRNSCLRASVPHVYAYDNGVSKLISLAYKCVRPYV